jgi:amino acid adenylation domain-containing protein
LTTSKFIGLCFDSILEHCEKTPNAIAIDDGTRVLSYGQLLTDTSQLSSYLQSVNHSRGDRVGLFMGNSLEACVGIISTLRADGCYVPLNPTYPTARIANIIEDSMPKCVFTITQHLEKLLESLNALDNSSVKDVFVLDGSSEDFENFTNSAARLNINLVSRETIDSADVPEVTTKNIDEDLAYVMYTSGTTGKPKGVMLTHRNIVSFISWASYAFQIKPSDRLSNHSHIGFDLSVFDIFGALCNGATVCPVLSAGDLMAPGKFIKDRKITIWFSVPSVIGMMQRFNQLTPSAFDENLRVAVFCGEALSPEYASLWIETHPDIPMFNLYGPTEATVAVTCHHVGVDTPFDPNTAIPIGKPCRDVEIQIMSLDEDTLVEPGEIGRIMICGAQLASGYWNKPSQTNEVFRVNPIKENYNARMYQTGDLGRLDPETGVLYCLGREDTQVKVMGFRIELGEIEVVIGRAPNVEEVVVLLVGDEDKRLVAAAATKGEVTEDELLDHAEKFLPIYMLPKEVVFYDQLPKNSNGKIDRPKIAEQIVNGSNIPTR